MKQFSKIVLWVWVIVAGVLIGGSIYEGVVLLPLWAGSPPESVAAWNYGVPQVRFFAVMTPFYGVLSLALLIAAFWMPGHISKSAMIAGALGLIVVVWTFFFFVPILQQTQATGGAGLSRDDVIQLTNSFVTWNYLRYILLLTGWFVGLRAFNLSGRPH